MPRKDVRKSAPARQIVSTQDWTVTLDEVLVAFQKTLSRARRSAQDYANREVAFATGRKTLYTIDRLDVELNAAFRLATADRHAPDLVHVNFEADPKERSVVRFAVSPLPFEPVADCALRLSDLDTLRTDPARFPLQVMLLGPATQGDQTTIGPLGKHNVSVMIAFEGREVSFSVTTATGKNAGGKEVSLAKLRLREAEQFSVLAISVDPPATSNVLTFKVPPIEKGNG
jgi:hypothetical protein